jgi:hypothetical protein
MQLRDVDLQVGKTYFSNGNKKFKYLIIGKEEDLLYFLPIHIQDGWEGAVNCFSIKHTHSPYDTIWTPEEDLPAKEPGDWL